MKRKKNATISIGNARWMKQACGKGEKKEDGNAVDEKDRDTNQKGTRVITGKYDYRKDSKGRGWKRMQRTNRLILHERL